MPHKVKVCWVTSWPSVSAASNSNGNKQSFESQWQWSECWLWHCIVSSLTSGVISHYGLMTILVQSSQSCSSKQSSLALTSSKTAPLFKMLKSRRDWWLTMHWLSLFASLLPDDVEELLIDVFACRNISAFSKNVCFKQQAELTTEMTVSDPCHDWQFTQSPFQSTQFCTK